MTNNVDRAAEIIAKEWGTFSTRDLCGHEIGIARALRRAGLLMPDGATAQTETVGPYFPENEEAPDVPEENPEMTDPRTPDVTDEDRRIARDWAESVKSYPDTWTDRLRAAARVILNDVPAPTTTPKENPEMPDQTLDDQLRPIVAAMRAAMRRDEHAYPEAKFLADLSGYIKDLEALLPARPTLADMDDDDRAACQWMQCDVKDDAPAVILRVGGLHVHLVDKTGVPFKANHADVTPRPDLPRLEWPVDTPAPAPVPEVTPGVTVGQPVTDPLVMLGISMEAPDGTVVIGNAPGCHPKATVKIGGTWQSVTGMRTLLPHALGENDYSDLESVTVVRWGKEADQ